MPRILILTANSKITPLQLAGEVQIIRGALGEHSNFITLHENEIQGRGFICLLIRHKPDILHFAGHGGKEETITLRGGDGGEGAPLSADHFGSILRHIPDVPKLIVLNACSTSAFAEAIEPFVSVVVGTNAKIGDKAALHFSKDFYTNIANSLPISAAFELAKISLELAGYRSDLLELKHGKEIYPANLIFYGRPELMASFKLTAGKPNFEGGTFKMMLWLRGADQD